MLGFKHDLSIQLHVVDRLVLIQYDGQTDSCIHKDNQLWSFSHCWQVASFFLLLLFAPYQLAVIMGIIVFLHFVINCLAIHAMITSYFSKSWEYELLYFCLSLYCHDQNFENKSNQDSVVFLVFLIYSAYILLQALTYSNHKFI